MSFVSFLSASVIIVVCVFLILLILIQRGKGGGLAGAFGGMGGQSAFGTKAGDMFMRITIVFAIFWFLLCIGVHVANKPTGSRSSGLDLGTGPGKSTSAPADPGAVSLPAAPVAPAEGAATTDK